MSHAYRADIDGLRAIAVASVLIFHAVPSWLGGGYVGVDVFFVISGYLITGILVREVHAGQFSVLQFYVRRARRLFPALLAMLVPVALAGWVLMLPDEFALLGKHIAAGAGFVSNLALWREAGYFDVSADLKPLLHLWSLGVEEQYYLLWPLMVALLARRPRWFWPLILAATALSFYLNVQWTATRPTAAFYLPLTRFWELTVGAALAMWQQGGAARRPAPGAASALSLLGLVLLAAPMLLLRRDTPFPGWPALLPVLGSALLIGAGPAAWVNRQLLARPAMVWLGLISYPLYLWHWPLLAYGHLAGGGPLPPASALALLALALLLAWITTHRLETLVRAPWRAALARRDAAVLWLLVLGCGGAGLAMWRGAVAPWSAQLPAVRQYAAAAADWVTPPDATLAGDSEDTVLFIGDSHMQQYVPRLVALAQRHQRPLNTLQIATLGGCAPLRGIDRRGAPCRQFVDAAFARAAAANVKTVVLAASWYGLAHRDDYFRAGDAARAPLAPFDPANAWLFAQWRDDLAAWRRAGKRVVVISSSPRGPLVDPRRGFDRGHLPWRALPTGAVPRALLARESAPYDAVVLAAARAAGAEVRDPYTVLCDASLCYPQAPDGAPRYLDESHLRASYVRGAVGLLDSLVYRDGAGAAAAPAPIAAARIDAAQK